MASREHRARILVLGKRQLGEADMVVSAMKEDGSLLEGVAKGARKPQSKSSGRLELFNKADVLCCAGRSLDVIKDTRLLRSREALHFDPLRAACASCVSEFSRKTIQPDLEVPRLFELADATFDALELAGDDHLPAVVSAFVFKASAYLGMRPSFSQCVCCGASVEMPGSHRFSDENDMSRLSYTDGGIVCLECAGECDSVAVPKALLSWCDMLLMSRYQDILETGPDRVLFSDLLRTAEQWALFQTGVRLKSSFQAFTYYSMLPDRPH